MIYHAYGMPGMGDVMMYLNIAHTKSYIHNTDVQLVMHWPHREDYLYHFEDPETIVERMDYIHSFYKDSGRVTVTHRFEEHDDWLLEHRFVSEENYENFLAKEPLWANPKSSRVWFLNRDQLQPIQSNKIVVWRPSFNAEEPRSWKLVLNHDQWQEVIDHLEEMGYNVIELTYRTPIREALYHCSTAEYAFFYDGMWHMMTTMLMTPTVVVGNTSIAMYNTINGIPIRTVGEMRRLLKNWYRVINWHVTKSNGKGKEEHIPRLSVKQVDGQSYIKFISKRMKGRLQRAYNKKADWTKRPILINERMREKYIDT